MALLSTVSNKFGLAPIEGAYTRITGANLIKIRGQFYVDVTYSSYVSAQALADGKDPINEGRARAPYNPEADANIHTCLYGFLKSLPEFEGAVDA